MIPTLIAKLLGKKFPDREPDIIDVNNRRYWLVKSQDDGYATWRLITHVGSGNVAAQLIVSWSDDDDILTLHDIKVESEYRRLGLASFLIEELKHTAASIGKTRIIGRISNNDIEGNSFERQDPQPFLPDFYRRCGFEVTELDYDDEGWWGSISFTSE